MQLPGLRNMSSIAIAKYRLVGTGKAFVKNYLTTPMYRALTVTFTVACAGTSRRLQLDIIARACLCTLVSIEASPFARRRGCNRFPIGFISLEQLAGVVAD